MRCVPRARTCIANITRGASGCKRESKGALHGVDETRGQAKPLRKEGLMQGRALTDG